MAVAAWRAGARGAGRSLPADDGSSSDDEASTDEEERHAADRGRAARAAAVVAARHHGRSHPASAAQHQTSPPSTPLADAAAGAPAAACAPCEGHSRRSAPPCSCRSRRAGAFRQLVISKLCLLRHGRRGGSSGWARGRADACWPGPFSGAAGRGAGPAKPLARH